MALIWSMRQSSFRVGRPSLSYQFERSGQVMAILETVGTFRVKSESGNWLSYSLSEL